MTFSMLVRLIPCLPGLQVMTSNTEALMNQESNAQGDIDFNNWYWHQSSSERNEQGLVIDYSSGELIVETDYGTTTAYNVDDITGTPGNDDHIIGSSENENLKGNGGQDVKTGGAGNDSFQIYKQQEKLTITDYESYEQIGLHGNRHIENGNFNFTKLNLSNELLVNYDEGTKQHFNRH